MLGVGLWAVALWAQTLAAATPAEIEDQLRRARNEYAYGNYEQAVELFKSLLYPMRLTTDEQVIEARKYLGLSHYLLGDKEAAQEEFGKLLYLSPDYELDPYSIAPPVIELFEGVRKKLKPALDAIRQRKSDEQLDQAATAGVRRVIEHTITERSDVATLLPFGAGQFHNGQVGWGIFFAVTELALLAVNVGSYLWADNLVYREDQTELRERRRLLILAQYTSLALFGVTWSVGVVHARLNFVPVVRAPPLIRDEPLSQALEVTPSLSLRLAF